MPDLPLKLGSTGDDVKRVQRSIVRDGYRSAANDLGLNGAEDVDGNFGPRTDTAVRRFQETRGLAVVVSSALSPGRLYLSRRPPQRSRAPPTGPRSPRCRRS